MACEKALEVMTSIPLSDFENIPPADETKSNLKSDGIFYTQDSFLYSFPRTTVDACYLDYPISNNFVGPMADRDNSVEHIKFWKFFFVSTVYLRNTSQSYR